RAYRQTNCAISAEEAHLASPKLTSNLARGKSMAYKVCHVERNVTDLDRAQKFYDTLFEWELKSFGDEMVVFGTGTEHIGGLSKTATVGAGDSPSVWLECPNIDDILQKASPAGGSIASEKKPLQGVGYTALIKDPDGNPVGLVQFER